ncbi:metal-dependent hydrolase [Chromobacterium violaceum]|uniref:metal-dependent hydrolase n=1 Tax=Chromobacterium violaceum TaxID=536 RepID=UPI0035A5E41E
MPTVVTHALAGATLVGLACRKPLSAPGVLPWLALCGAAAMLPDLDVVTFKLGIPYASPWGHRGFSHSLAAAALLAGLLAWLCRPVWQRAGLTAAPAAALLFLAVASHPMLDMICDASFGPALFMPWSEHRYLSGWRPIEGSPIGLKRWFGAKGWRVVHTEFLYVWLPCLALWASRCLWLSRSAGARA